jgi:hypothetical protein
MRRSPAIKAATGNSAMRLAIAAFVLLAAATVAQAQQTHPCSADAIAKAALLLRFHNSPEPGQPADVEQNAKMLPPIKALKGNGRFDVLEVVGHIYKASYRMRQITRRSKARAC